MTDSELGLGFDLELDGLGRLSAVGAILGDAEFRRSRVDRSLALQDLDAFAAPAEFVFGHNVLWHDLPWLRKHAPELRLLEKPVVDTLVLSTIAFAEHPYHALVKDYKLVRDAVNDPVGDSRISARVLHDARQRLRKLAAAEPRFVRVLRSLGARGLASISPQASAGFALAFETITAPATDLDTDLDTLLADRSCATARQALLPFAKQPPDLQLDLLFVVAWLRVGGTPDALSPSVVMPWVRRRFPKVAELLHALRDVPCHRPGCGWCVRMHDAVRQLTRWFGYPDFRPTPTLTADGRPAQRAIVDAGFADRPLLALLPTGGGKSLCFQLPAIQRYLRRGCLTVVISPLQSLMHDQVDSFVRKTNADCAVALTGRLTPPERRAALDAIRSGHAGILYVSPEQLRNSTFHRAIAFREIGAWVFDEAHCLSKWGHDFRPDYLYAARFIREFSAEQGVACAPIVCVTATAKPEVRDEILLHFRSELGQELQYFDGHQPRQNLTLRVEAASGAAKVTRVREIVAEQLALHPTGSVLIYTATRRGAEELAALLEVPGIPAEAFHAGLDVPSKKAVQERFLSGESRVVCATNAFGMGIDKPDVRLVVHFDIPGSLEAYVQEVGRAGRDGQPAEAVLLFAPDDIELQFRFAAASRLDLRDLRGVLKRVRHLARPARIAGAHEEVREAICTSGEILQDEGLAERIDPNDRNAPTRVVTAIAWLERGKFLFRDENATSVFQGRPLVASLDLAEEKLRALNLPGRKAAAWKAILRRLMNADSDEGLVSDDLLGLPEVVGVVNTSHAPTAGRWILRTLLEMQKARLLSSGLQMTAFLRHGVAGASRPALDHAASLEMEILAILREQEPDPEPHRSYPLRLRSLSQALATRMGTAPLLQMQKVLGSMADRAAHAGSRAAGLRLRFTASDHCQVEVRGTWDQVFDTARRRHRVAHVCLQVLHDRLPDAQMRGASLLVEFTLEQLLAAIRQDLHLRSDPAPDPPSEIEYALLFLHRIGAVVLHKGFAVFRQAMILRVPESPGRRNYTRDDYLPLAEHQNERTVQIHTMHEFAQRMERSPADGLRLLDDYFRLPRDVFLDRHFKKRRAELERATSAESWRRIVKGLSAEQREVVTANENESLLVLAGPGSGKTRVVVHRCAYLLRVKRVPARAILVLCYNRSAGLELRRRLRDLVGDDSGGVLVQTYHGMACRLLGCSPADRIEAGATPDVAFVELMRAAVAQLAPGSSDTAATDSEELRDRLLAGFRHILVDEYQDIDAEQYQLVSAIAGRTLRDPDRKLTVLAVGDDDQNIYEFRHASVEFLRRFESDYSARRLSLVENYRSTAHILAASGQLIAQNRERLKRDTPIRVDRARQQAAPGGRFEELNHPARGRVQILEIPGIAGQAPVVLRELRRLWACDAKITPERCAVLSPTRALLDPVRAVLEQEGIPVRYRVTADKSYSLFRLREVQEFLSAVDAAPVPVDTEVLNDLLARLRSRFPRECNVALVAQTTEDFLDEYRGYPDLGSQLREFFGEVLLEQRRERVIGSGVMLGTVHGSKGAEYDHVILLDGGWRGRNHDSPEQRRRLYYVGMTRARETLTLMHCRPGGAPWIATFRGASFHRSRVEVATSTGSAPQLRCELLSQADIALSFAGRVSHHAEIERALEDVATGDRLNMVVNDGGVFLETAGGVRVGALSKAAARRWRPRAEQVREVRVAAILVRHRSDEADGFRVRLRRDAWQVVVPEICSCEHSQGE
ncbi:MAG: RecQ family ATP-dependent DNA helicase [Planctomycetes bacterium]|nr:RecQ family ATP-dependent DNA helicase [Planctomycetota bacterium]MCB9868768.1 RecQ family ATP-dependent DNA helicase [Planctomycetota bacterium]